MGTSSFTSSGLSVTGFDSNTTAAGAITSQAAYTGSGLSSFILVDNGGSYFAWNWGATTDAETFFGTPAGNPIASPAHDVVPANEQIVSQHGSDAWSMTIKLSQIGNNAVGANGPNPGDSLSDASGVILTSTAALDGDFNTVTVTGTGANSLAAEFRNLSIGLGAHSGETFGVTFSITDTVSSVVVPTFTEVFSLSGSACYAAGTRVATPSGEARVETLSIGDLVATGSGIAKPVKWVGRRTYTAAQVAANGHLRPVIIRRDALAPAMPHHDLSVSPMHALFLDGVFVPAAALVNGVTVLRSEAMEPVEYIHIELDDHDVIFAEGAPAETFVDDNSRLMFDNADEYYDIYGAEDGFRGFSAPRIEEGYQLEAVRRHMATRAGLPAATRATPVLRGHVESVVNGMVHGWVTDNANPGTPVELDIMVEGEAVARVLANRYRADLDHAGIAGGRCAFSVALPASVVSAAQVEIRHTADGVALPMPQVVALVN